MSSDTSYVIYNSPGSVKNMDRNTPKNPTQFPLKMYKGSTLNPSKTQPQYYRDAGVVPYVRDTKVDYILHVDRDDHPENFSRFGYPWCENGYCTGNHPGRYNTPPGMQWMTRTWPSDLAPKRFYQGVHVDVNYCDSDAYITSRRARSIRSSGM